MGRINLVFSIYGSNRIFTCKHGQKKAVKILHGSVPVAKHFAALAGKSWRLPEFMNYLATILFIFFTVNVCCANELSGFVALQTNVQLIAIDPGFGGKDHGPLGCNGIAHAKDINLQIAKKVAAKIQSDLGINTLLTRDNDIYVSLADRAAIANTHNADLLISIHTNASENESVYGIETFYLHLFTDDQVLEEAAIMNVASQKNIADMDMVLSELMANALANESDKLANNIQRHLHNQLSKKYDRIKNRGVK